MKKVGLMLALVLSVASFTSCFSQNEKAKSNINWMGVQDAINQSQKDGKDAKLFFIDCYTSWCGWCKVLDQKTFSNDTVAAILNYYYYPCKFDAEGSEDVTIGKNTYKGNAKAGKRGGTHELMKVIWEGQNGGGYPSMSIRRGDFTNLECVMGYVEAPKLEVILVYYAEKFNKDMSIEKFASQYYVVLRFDVLKKVFNK